MELHREKCSEYVDVYTVILILVPLAVLRVERWLEELHDRRRLIEASFRSRKTQLEQCLALALLATDLRDLEEILNDRIAALAGSCDQLGDSASSAELLLYELKKLQAEAKVLRKQNRYCRRQSATSTYNGMIAISSSP